MKRDLYNLFVFILVVVAVALLLSCSTKKKTTNVQKEQIEQASSVKLEQKGTVSDSSKKVKNVNVVKGQKYQKKITFKADSSKKDKNGNTTFYGVNAEIDESGESNESFNLNEAIQNAIKANQTVNKDSTGNLKKDSKSKDLNKHVKESTSGKVWGIGFLILMVLIASYLIRKQQRRVKEAVDLFI